MVTVRNNTQAAVRRQENAPVSSVFCDTCKVLITCLGGKAVELQDALAEGKAAVLALSLVANRVAQVELELDHVLLSWVSEVPRSDHRATAKG
jgi:hypothetical protein